MTPLPQPQPPRLVKEPPLLEVVGLSKTYGRIPALDHVSLSVAAGEVFGVVGESGSGKSTLLRLLNLEETADPHSGSYTLALPSLAGRNLLTLDRFERRGIRVAHLGIVYQNPHVGLRMRHTSGGNVAERLILTGARHFATIRDEVARALAASDFPGDRIDDPPTRLSGGMQQRVQLARATILRPALLLLDEPTTGLDVSVQARVLDTLKRLRQETGVTTILVSHDLGVIRTLADRVAVMRHGRIVERGLTDQVLEDPQHPYTRELVQAQLS